MSSLSFEMILTHIIVGTDALMVGIDILNVQDVIVLHPGLLGESLQGIGRW